MNLKVLSVEYNNALFMANLYLCDQNYGKAIQELKTAGKKLSELCSHCSPETKDVRIEHLMTLGNYIKCLEVKVHNSPVLERLKNRVGAKKRSAGR